MRLVFLLLFLSPKDHTRFCNIVRYSPDGNTYCTGGSDGQAILYDGKTGDKKGTLGGAKAHDGSVYSVSCTHVFSSSLSLPPSRLLSLSSFPSIIK